MFTFYLILTITLAIALGFFIGNSRQKPLPLIKRENLEKTPTQAVEYFVGKAQDGETEIDVLFTAKEVEKAVKRAEKNKEDLID